MFCCMFYFTYDRSFTELVTTCAARVLLFSVVSVCVFACLSVWMFVNTVTPEPLEISSRNFQGIILWSKGRTSSKMVI